MTTYHPKFSIHIALWLVGLTTKNCFLQPCDLFGNYYAITRYSNILSRYVDTGSSALESCHCGGYIYYKWWHRLVIKHTWHTITGTNKIFQNPGAKTYSVIPCVHISPYTSLSHNLCDWYLIISWSSIDCQLNYLSIWLLVHSSVLANNTK